MSIPASIFSNDAYNSSYNLKTLKIAALCIFF